MAYGSLTPGQSRPWGGGLGNGAVTGSFAGETVTLEVSYDDGATWVAVGEEAILSAPGTFIFELPSGVLLRYSVAGGAGAGLNLIISGRIN